ncbi:MAG: hypothetical protein ACRDOK_08080 [Streptosporangiaceae bacterium]
MPFSRSWPHFHPVWTPAGGELGGWPAPTFATSRLKREFDGDMAVYASGTVGDGLAFLSY